MSEYRSGESASQPTENSAFTAPENPVTRNKAEAAEARQGDHGSGSHPVTHRGPGEKQGPEGADEWGLGRGARGSQPVNSTEAKETHHVNKGDAEDSRADLDGDANIADVPAGEGKVADAEQAKHGVQRYKDQDVTDEGHEEDFSSDLDR